MKETPARPLPHIGLRNLKTALSASLCALIYFFLNRNPAFACIGAIFGMGADMDHSKLHGGNRLFGTVIGGFLGIGLYRIYLVFFPPGGVAALLSGGKIPPRQGRGAPPRNHPGGHPSFCTMARLIPLSGTPESETAPPSSPP